MMRWFRRATWFTDIRWNFDCEDAAFIGHAVHGDVAAHQLAETSREREAKSGAAKLAGGGSVGLREGLEQLHQLFGLHSNTGVGDAEVNPFAIFHDFASNFN